MTAVKRLRRRGLRDIVRHRSSPHPETTMPIRLILIALPVVLTVLSACSSTAGRNTTYARPAASPAAIQIPLN